ncbi:diacylglycerol kinase [Elysia marginata]|uniref:Diacylglycerol kinase n=1 Tax=Elysia marginata TaxID=1093978 RepID=A0AAV4IDE6_9GAST|nr:diacylglycerol kinase [Elysia marginata]
MAAAIAKCVWVVVFEAKSLDPAFEIRSWTLEEVGQWLDSLALGDYKESFMSHEITGAELLNLERRDLKDLGVTKVGHLKRIQEGIKELHHREAVYDRPSS